MFARSPVVVSLILPLLLSLGCQEESSSPAQQEFEVIYDETTGHLQVIVHPELKGSQSLFFRVRNGGVGVLNCETQINADMVRIDGNSLPPRMPGDGARFDGFFIDKQAFEDPYDITWFEQEPTDDMIAAAAAQLYTMDICLMDGTAVTRAAEMDVVRALDKKGTGKFDGYGDQNEQIVSVSAYAEACVAQMGEIPFFPKLEEGDYGTYSCLNSVPIPMTVTDAEGNVTRPSVTVADCDNPQFIYSSCEPNAVTGVTNGPRVASSVNEQGTTWVLLCRKSLAEEGQYNDVAMIGHNPYTGKTCYFQNALYSRRDGVHVPHPGDVVNSPQSPQQSESLWSGIQGGIGSGVECVKCHNSDPYIHSPWIGGALLANGDPVIPKLGITEGFAEGFNEAPYSLVDLEGQGWTMPNHLVSEEAAACTKCHRIGDGRWTRKWIDRLVGENGGWAGLLTEEGSKFENVYWMPPELEGVDENTWGDSEFGRAVAFIQDCGDKLGSGPPSSPTPDTSDDDPCKWEPLPTEQMVDFGELPEVELEGIELAREAAKILGANVFDQDDTLRCDPEDGACRTDRCAECHSVSKTGLKHWLTLTKEAKVACNLGLTVDEMTQEQARAAVNCLRAIPEEEGSVFAADKTGIFTTGVKYGDFRSLFQKAYGDDYWLPQYIQFKQRVAMPKGSYPAFSQMEYATILKWFDSGLANMVDVIVDPPAPTTCDNYVDTEFMTAHTNEMKYDGWGALNRDAGIVMFGCEDQANAFSCFKDAIPHKEWSAGEGNLLEVAELQFRTSFWTRSSADGRFVGNGGGSGVGATVTDLQQTPPKDIGVKSSYDPGFFPDNSGFIFQGGGSGARICLQSVLENTDMVDYESDACMKGTDINLYQHVAKGLNGGDYFIINSQFTSDSGGANTNRDPKAMFNAQSRMKFTPMINAGTTYEQLSAVKVDSPFEGDSVLSPSGRLVISRQSGAPDAGTLGYVVRRVEKEKIDDNYIIKIDQMVGKYCFSGAKANISFDERFFVTHHYEGDGTANIILVDMLTGAVHNVTKMPTGMRALFPHFRSDNWFYFLVRGAEHEYVVASDLALQLSANESE